MKVIMCAGPPTSGKTMVLRQVARRLLAKGCRLAYLKIDVQYADEDELFHAEFGIPARKVYSGELCPDHAGVLVLGDAVKWAAGEGADTLFVEKAGGGMGGAPGEGADTLFVETAGLCFEDPARALGPRGRGVDAEVQPLLGRDSIGAMLTL